ncbi:glutamate-ammonia-ligase adenylyltransferase [Persephonella hydrogeniphila]|uniref:Glutamate-ammonia-ligase adenylyltransferase n=1 Tax=Persephonella hydrogeniphila TaxID=198703 RepID=A0A285NFB0_9AQUI|nr:glutamine-synthetase adenylyltransferase [Persephonella hydrogeniphila]SNZ06586.1 glutamate-ammonia-ligase adenylyltransferase [Persephonella hydrogeniphila]
MAKLTKFETLKKDFLQSLSPEKYTLLERLADYSSCIADFIFRHPDQLDYIHDNIDRPLLGRDKLIEEIKELQDINDTNLFAQKLTFFKLKHFSRIVAKDIYKKHDLLDLTEEYSYLADASFEACYRKAIEKVKKRYGTPIDQETGKEAEGSIIALGKLGGLDLNYYSDVDVMYVYSNEGKTDKGISNREFFIEVFKNVTMLMTKRNIEGQPWVVDLDLRPEGKKGFIAYSLPAIEFYYWSHGRTWERHMLIKARHSAGNKDVSKEFMRIVKPFVYRKHAGIEVFEEIVEMKRLIEEEARKKIKDAIDIKRSEGCIREIEFTVQVFQLMYGGKIPELQERRTVKVLEKLVKHKILSENQGKLLKEAYYFLRNLEHIIQIKNCIQTQTFHIKDAEEYARKMGFTSKEEFLKKLNSLRKEVKSIFEGISPDIDIKLTPLQSFILTKHYEEEAQNYLKSLGFKNPEWALNMFKDIFFSKLYIELSENSKEVLFSFIPTFENKLKEFEDREDFLLNFRKMMIDGGMLWVFVSALEQNPNLVEFMLNIAKFSDYISDLMSKDRELLDWAFGIEDVPREKKDFEKELSVIPQNIDSIDRLKKLKKIVEVLVSLQYLSKIHTDNPEERLRDINYSLSNLADFILEQLYLYYRGEDFAIYSLGKLGSREMNIGSDLDLIFVFKDEESKNRLIKIPVSIVKALTSYSGEGILYNIDLRLRPFGKGGELSPSLSFYKNYFQKEARVWERLAWTKARFITGDKNVKDSMEKIIEEFLFGSPIDRKFINEAVDMRFKLEGLARETPEEMDIKLGKGGITDIEFLVQIYILKNKKRITNILEGVEIFKENLIDDYLFLREVEARLRMIKGVGLSKIYRNSPFLYRISHSFGIEPDELWERLIETKKEIRNIFLREIKILRERG